MTKIETLLKTLCPNGVEYRRLGTLGFFYSGLTGKCKDDFKNGNNKFITYMNVYKNSSIDIEQCESVFISDNERQNVVKSGDVLFTGSSETADECGMSSVYNFDDSVYLNSFCFGFRINNLNLYNVDFLKHLFRSTNVRKQIIKTASGVTRFNVSKQKMENIKIPVPPLAVQGEIVRILDNFTELTARKKQYEFYRNHLLSFDDDVPRVKLGDLFDTKNGYTPSKNNANFWNNGTIPWFRMEDIRENGRILSDSIQHITAEAVKGSVFKKDSIIISTSATIGEYALLRCESVSNQRFTYLNLKEKYKKDFDIMFLFHYCWKLSEFCKNNLNQGNFASVDMTRFNNFEFPKPSLSEQERIIKILDHFDALCNDISMGLPAEIAARQRQYEHYRDELLNFEKVAL